MIFAFDYSMDVEIHSDFCIWFAQAACYLKHTKTQDLNETYYEIFGWRDGNFTIISFFAEVKY